MRDRTGVALAVPPPVAWPPDDTEESVLGTNFHQTAIRDLIAGINEAAALATPEGTPLLWQAGGQTMVTNFRRRDHSAYTTLPDVFVYRQALDVRRASFDVETDGPPVLIIEVLSPTTHENDLDMVDGKGYSYAHAGVLEYLILDPGGSYLAEQGQGWRFAGGVYRPWQREADGRWRSRQIPVALGLEGLQASVHTADGERLLREGENARERERLRRQRADDLAAKERQRLDDLAAMERQRLDDLAAMERRHLAELAARDAELAKKEAELDHLHRRLEELGGQG